VIVLDPPNQRVFFALHAGPGTPGAQSAFLIANWWRAWRLCRGLPMRNGIVADCNVSGLAALESAKILDNISQPKQDALTAPTSRTDCDLAAGCGPYRPGYRMIAFAFGLTL